MDRDGVEADNDARMIEMRGNKSGCIGISLVVAFVACSSSGSSPGTENSPATARPSDGAEERARPPSRRHKLTRSKPLPALAKKVMRTTMRRHGDNMENLLWSALMLDHKSTAAIAELLIEEPRIARPSADGDTLNSVFPPEFFRLQDDMRAAANDLRGAAADADDLRSADAYARLAETCVSCHSLYLRIPGEGEVPE